MISPKTDSVPNSANYRLEVACPSDSTTIPELQQLAEYVVYLEDLREEEERSLARNLHNLIGQSLTSIGLGVEIARLGSVNKELSILLNDLKENVRIATDDVRCLLRQLRPAALDDLGVEAAIQGLVRETCSAGLDCRFEGHLKPGQRFDTKTETAAFRIVQQFLGIIVRDAGATEACVCLRSEGDCLELEIAIYGPTFVVGPPVGKRSNCSGLQGIQRRVELLKGSVTVFALDRDYTRIHVSLPNTLVLT
jgi:two-component system sensor histidine kinase UhpB